MFKGHPKGLFVLALANTGERFGYYTMLAIFALYLQAKFGFTAAKTSLIYGTFMSFVYFLPLVGGYIADKFLGYTKTVMLGIIIMFFGYVLMATPTNADDTGFAIMVIALALVCLGTGLFKGNLQVLIGNLYDDAKYGAKRDVAFSIFYMFINIGAFFAPHAADYVSNYVLAKDNLKYEAKVPDLSIKYVNYKVVDSVEFSNLLTNEAKAKGKQIEDFKKYLTSEKKKQGVFYASEKEKIGNELEVIGREQLKDKFTTSENFARTYSTSLSKSYNWGFGVACFSLIISILIYLGFRGTYKHVDIVKRKKGDETPTVAILSPEETKERIIALLLVFGVVIFFWMAFNQSGLSMTFFARDYTNLKIGKFDYLWFSLETLLLFIAAFYGILNMVQNKETSKRLLGAALLIGGLGSMAFIYLKLAPESSSITPQIFQEFNPLFIILVTPLFVAFFTWLNSKGKEPSSPRKIGYGMLIAALGFTVLIVASIGQKAPSELVGVSENLISPYWLVSTYFVLTLAELLLSPMGISFVSKVALPQYRGLMQGGWSAATAIGNNLVGVLGMFWDKLPLWLFWSVLVICCTLSFLFIFSIMKKLDRATGTI